MILTNKGTEQLTDIKDNGNKYLPIKNTKLRTLFAYSLLWQINT